MKRLLSVAIFLLALLPASIAPAQSSQTYQQTWGPVTQTGPVGTARNYRIYGSVPSSYTVDWFNDHAAATACTFQVEGSSDNVHYYALTSSTDCTASGMLHIANKPVMFLRINVLTFAPGDSSTAEYFNYTRGQ